MGPYRHGVDLPDVPQAGYSSRLVFSAKRTRPNALKPTATGLS